SRLIGAADFACQSEDGAITMVMTESALRHSHVVARRIASVMRHTMLEGECVGGHRIEATLASLKATDSPQSLLARVCEPVAAAAKYPLVFTRPFRASSPSPFRGGAAFFPWQSRVRVPPPGASRCPRREWAGRSVRHFQSQRAASFLYTAMACLRSSYSSHAMRQRFSSSASIWSALAGSPGHGHA